MKLYVNMPSGEGYGWAICGKYTILELSKLTDVRYVPDELFDTAPKDRKTEEFIKSITEAPNGNAFNYLQAIDNVSGNLKHKGSKNVGYMFYEEETIQDALVSHLKEFDLVATGSDWNTEVVKRYGIDAVTVHQGINSELFKPLDKKLFKDKFVIFSGGKLEHRKAQDIVAYVVGKFQKKHDDVLLITSWGNVFFDDKLNNENMKRVKEELNPTQTIMLDICPQWEMVKYIAESDIGIFPNRIEGGTNLVMMEYMSCGKPVIAHNATGQKDVLSDDYAFLVEGKQDDIIDQCMNSLEIAYQNRNLLTDMGLKARDRMKKFTWEKTAKEFMKLYA